MSRPLSPAARIHLSLGIIADNRRILRDPLLTASERRAYMQSSVNARARLREARIELLMEPPVEPAVEVIVEVVDEEPGFAELPWSALVYARGRLAARAA